MDSLLVPVRKVAALCVPVLQFVQLPWQNIHWNLIRDTRVPLSDSYRICVSVWEACFEKRVQCVQLSKEVIYRLRKTEGEKKHIRGKKKKQKLCAKSNWYLNTAAAPSSGDANRGCFPTDSLNYCQHVFVMVISLRAQGKYCRYTVYVVYKYAR